MKTRRLQSTGPASSWRSCSVWRWLVLVVLAVSPCLAQESAQQVLPEAPKPKPQEKLKVNWLYGAYLSKNVPLEPLTGEERFRLYMRKNFTTSSPYIRTAFFALIDQAKNSPSGFGGGMGGYGRRLGSNYGQSVIQSTISSTGNALVGYEPRYDRCQCSGFWARTKHAVIRNFVTYNRTERELRPQIALYIGTFGAGVAASTWKPNDRSAVEEGYHNVISQTYWGVLSNWIGEFAPDIKRKLFRRK